jgi:non-specific serine/threonine protein kinase
MLLRRPAVFSGGWSLEAAQAVCRGYGIDSERVLELMANLVDKSLVVVEERGGAMRYWLLDALRHYALGRLHGSGEEARARSLHREWCVALAERFDNEWRGPGQRGWFQTLEREAGNLRVALRGRGQYSRGM